MLRVQQLRLDAGRDEGSPWRLPVDAGPLQGRRLDTVPGQPLRLQGSALAAAEPDLSSSGPAVLQALRGRKSEKRESPRTRATTPLRPDRLAMRCVHGLAISSGSRTGQVERLRSHQMQRRGSCLDCQPDCQPFVTE